MKAVSFVFMMSLMASSLAYGEGCRLDLSQLRDNYGASAEAVGTGSGPTAQLRALRACVEKVSDSFVATVGHDMSPEQYTDLIDDCNALKCQE